MSDAAFASAPYSGYTDEELQSFIKLDMQEVARMDAELHRREQARKGVRAVMTSGERFRWVRDGKEFIE